MAIGKLVQQKMGEYYSVEFQMLRIEGAELKPIPAEQKIPQRSLFWQPIAVKKMGYWFDGFKISTLLKMIADPTRYFIFSLKSKPTLGIDARTLFEQSQKKVICCESSQFNQQ